MKKRTDTHSPAVLPARANKSMGRKNFRPIDAFLALATLIIVGVGAAAAGMAYQSFVNAGNGDTAGATAILTYSEQQIGSMVAEEDTDETAEGDGSGDEANATARPNGYSGNRADLKIALQSNPDTNKIGKDYAKVLDADGYKVDVIAPYPYDHTLVVYRYPEVAEEAQHIADTLGASKCFWSYTENRDQYDADILISIGPGIAPAPAI